MLQCGNRAFIALRDALLTLSRHNTVNPACIARVDQVNDRYAMEYTSTTKQALDELLCVASDNAEVSGSYLTDPGSFEGDSTVFDDPRGQKEFAYTDVIPGEGNARGSAKVGVWGLRCRPH